MLSSEGRSAPWTADGQPIPPRLILGKTIPFALIGFFDMFLVTAVGVIWFEVPIRGSIPLLVLATAVYLLSVLGFGLFISTISRPQQQAMMATFLFFAPAVLLSGLMFPIETCPRPSSSSHTLTPCGIFSSSSAASS